MKSYIDLMTTISQRRCEKDSSFSGPIQNGEDKHMTVVKQNSKVRIPQSSDHLYQIRILALGKYLPRRIVRNEEIEEQGGFSKGSVDRQRHGVIERRRADVVNGERQSVMAAAAVRAALKQAGMTVSEVDCFINASAGPEQVLPDGAALLQRELGQEAEGTAAFSVHASCLSFVKALDVAGALITSGRYQAIVISSTEVTSRTTDWRDEHTAPLFGDAAVAAIIVPSGPDESSAVHKIHFETHGSGVNLCEISGGGTARPPASPRTQQRDHVFRMDAAGSLCFAGERLGLAMERLQPGLSTSMKDIDWVVPHQASACALDALTAFGWDPTRTLRTIGQLGNCVAASIPLTLLDGIERGDIVRGNKLLLCGTAAGMSFGGALLTF